MASYIQLIDGQSGYQDILHYVAENGRERRPRGLKTLDVGYTTIEFTRPYNMLPIGTGRKLSRRIAAAEAIQLIGGFSDPQLLLSASPNFKRYVEPSGEFHGAYGRRIHTQLGAVVNKLRDDPETRQAIITLWNPVLDNERDKKDYPCTLSLGFSIWDKHVELDVTMRSNDVWRGLPYDIFQFTQLQHTVANVLGLIVGRYRHHTYSLHLYEEDRVEAFGSSIFPDEIVKSFQPTGFTNNSLAAVMQRCRWIAEKSAVVELSMDDNERWYWDALHPAK